jgi:2-polyprenyl-3-methyl-5-hydroxy-6-metoxy-1,4-benzoquinol methylase
MVNLTTSTGGKVNRSLLVRFFGSKAALFHGGPSILDRWRWLTPRLPRTKNGEKLIDLGCGTGAFTICTALRGYESTGLSWDSRNQKVAEERASICGAKNAEFPIQDIRKLDERTEYNGRFDVAICFEVIEHIIDDKKLMLDIYRCLKPGGFLYLTTPSYFYRPISPIEQGPFSKTEDGWHVRRGYTSAMLRELADIAGFQIEEISSCSGFFSQKVAAIIRKVNRFGAAGWALTAPLRLLPPLLDRLVGKVINWPDYSICMVVYKPRFHTVSPEKADGQTIARTASMR